MAISSPLPRLRSRAVAKDAAAPAAYALGALLLAGEAAVHVQQYASEFHDVRWIGPLFLANAAAVVVTIAGMTIPRTRRRAALAGVVISAIALGSLIVSYGHGLFGWQEAGFRTPVALAMITEAAAVILLATALTLEPEASMTSRRARPVREGLTACGRCPVPRLV
jgi:hypothetical protein